MSENMTLKDSGLEFEDADFYFNFKVEAGGIYLRHVARKMSSLRMEGKIANLFLFQPDFDWYTSSLNSKATGRKQTLLRRPR